MLSGPQESLSVTSIPNNFKFFAEEKLRVDAKRKSIFRLKSLWLIKPRLKSQIKQKGIGETQQQNDFCMEKQKKRQQNETII